MDAFLVGEGLLDPFPFPGKWCVAVGLRTSDMRTLFVTFIFYFWLVLISLLLAVLLELISAFPYSLKHPKISERSSNRINLPVNLTVNGQWEFDHRRFNDTWDQLLIEWLTFPYRVLRCVARQQPFHVIVCLEAIGSFGVGLPAHLPWGTEPGAPASKHSTAEPPTHVSPSTLPKYAFIPTNSIFVNKRRMLCYIMLGDQHRHTGRYFVLP